MLAYGPIIASLLAGVAVVLVFWAGWVLLQAREAVGNRLEELGGRTMLQSPAAVYPAEQQEESRLKQLFSRFGIGSRISLALTRADLPLTVVEFVLIVVSAAALGFVGGTVRLSPWLGLALAGVFGAIPFVYLGFRRRRRLRQLTEQIPDMLTLLVGALRAGYGLSQALEILVERMGPPLSTEINRVTRAISLGLPLKQALQDMAERVGSDDLSLIVIAITVQYDIGGNLAETLETIGDTVRHRLRILRDIRVLTAQQRFTGYVLAVLPVGVALLLFVINPEYIGRLFEPGMIRLLPIAAVLLQLLGFFIISRIVDIEV